jgi:hypothetical protein
MDILNISHLSGRRQAFRPIMLHHRTGVQRIARRCAEELALKIQTASNRDPVFEELLEAKDVFSTVNRGAIYEKPVFTLRRSTFRRCWRGVGAGTFPRCA